MPVEDQPADLKIILLGDSAAGKTKLVERFLVQSYSQQNSSTYAITVFRHSTKHPTTGQPLAIDFYDTAGQERFASMHASYYYGAHACLLCFDLTRKVTYKNLDNWYRELRQYRPKIPVLILANKVDVQPDMAKRDFKFAVENQLPVMFVSASDGTNVVAAFETIISRALDYKASPDRDFMDDVLDMLRDTPSPATALAPL
ncbi:small GTP-binding protein domain [Allomyces macrogynus ATCC 38327]|uniref:Small GTP-binding protein domain n=1 Tax=Allomyces macrogynus (strain ATCC 38327) TaxID=578462 RepID=A0A0L0S046_ALLM3|nr:small GTP-binding protein domain [Allomyces macrogynus ATCC 38327]|eukprot:KNE55987.1 small GTP-binding protein domain [Allomyces macrogynus ATCC 38327]